MKTENATEVGLHVWEKAGLGKAPFRFIGTEEKVISYPDGTTQAAGTCDYCGMGIRHIFRCQSADGKTFGVGCDCIERVGEKGILKAYRSSKEYRAKMAEQRSRKADKVRDELEAIIRDNAEKLASLPHPMGFKDRATDKPLTALDYATWMLKNAGASGKARLLKIVKGML